MKRPAFQFYPADWLRDTGLRTCSPGARGLWIDMICFMHEGDPYGYLKVNLKVILPPNLSRMVGATLAETEGWLNELEDAGCFSRDADGCIFSRRMISDEVIRNKRAAGGILGGNPALKVRGRLTLEVKQKPTPSSSSSPSSSSISPTIVGDKKKYRGTIEELKSFASEIGLPESDGESMFHHWESNGWRNGSSPSKNWKAGIQKWKSQGWLPSQKSKTNGKHPGGNHAGSTEMQFTGEEF